MARAANKIEVDVDVEAPQPSTEVARTTETLPQSNTVSIPGTQKIVDHGDHLVVTVEDGLTFNFVPEALRTIYMVQNTKARSLAKETGQREADFLGKFALNERKFVDEINIIPVASVVWRKLMDGAYKPGVERNVVCRSYDGQHPASNIMVPVSHQCGPRFCKKAVWPKGGSPECEMFHRVEAFDVDRKSRVLFFFKGLAFSAWERLSKAWANEVNDALIDNIPLESFYINITSEVNEEPVYAKYIFKYKSNEDVAKLAPVVSYCKKLAIEDANKFAEPFDENAATTVTAKQIEEDTGSTQFTTD